MDGAAMIANLLGVGPAGAVPGEDHPEGMQLPPDVKQCSKPSCKKLIYPVDGKYDCTVTGKNRDRVCSSFHHSHS